MRASLAEIQGDLGKINQTVNSWSAQMRRSLKNVEDSLNRSIGGFFSLRTAMALIGGGVIAATIQRFIAFGDEISDTSKRLNVNAETLQEWRYAVQLSGGDAESLTKALEKFQRTIGEMKMGLFTESVTKAQESLGKLGLRLSDLSGLSPEDQFKVVIDRIKAIPDAAQQSSIAFELFGRSAGQIMNTIRGGSQGLREAAEEARRFGLVLDEETIKKADAANDELTRMGIAARVSGARLSAEMLPALTRLREIMTSPEFQNAIKVLAKAFNSMFDTQDVRATVEAQGGIDAMKRKLVELSEAAFENRQEIDRLANTWAYKIVGVGRVTASRLDTQASALERQAARLDDLIQRHGRLPTVPTQVATPIEPIDRRNEEQVKKALEDLAFRAQVARQEFAALAQGTPEVVHGLGALGQAALKAYLEGKPLPDMLRKINDAQNRLNASNLHQELLEPLEKYSQELERLNVLWTSGNLTLQDYNRQMFRLRETLAQTSGSAISLQHAAQGIGQAFGTATESAIMDFTKLNEVAIALIKDIQRALLQAFITKPITNSITNFLGGSGGVLSGLFGGGIAGNPWASGTTATRSDRGNVFSHGRVIPHKMGGILDKAIAWPMGSSVGTAAESHKEGIFPIARGPDGKLGVMNAGESGTTVVNYHFSPGMTPADMAMIQSQMAQADRATENRIIGNIRGAHQTDSNFLFAG